MPSSPTTTTTPNPQPKPKPKPAPPPPRSRRACSDPIGNGIGPDHQTSTLPGTKGCPTCNNDDHYGFGKSVCGRCGRCHGCGSTNNGIGPVQAMYLGGKWVVRKVGRAVKGSGGGEGGGEARGGGG